MAIEDKRTKADLLDELEQAKQAVQEARSAAYEAQQALPSPPVDVPEATALAACIRTIDAMKQGSRSSFSAGHYSNSSGGFYESGSRYIGDVERILRTLAARYQIDLIEVRTDPCSRRHLDDINPDRIMQALHS